MFHVSSFRLQVRGGFTLMELLISIGIFLFITAMVIVNFHSGRYRDELVGAAEAISTSIREAQTATNAGDTVACVPPDLEPPANGFGVSLNLALDTSATHFADCPGAATYVFDGSDIGVKTVTWSNRVPITEVEVVGAPATTIMDILFSPTSEKVRLNGSDAYTNGVITLTHEQTSRQAEVQINAITGQVFIVYL